MPRVTGRLCAPLSPSGVVMIALKSVLIKRSTAKSVNIRVGAEVCALLLDGHSIERQFTLHDRNARHQPCWICRRHRPLSVRTHWTPAITTFALRFRVHVWFKAGKRVSIVACSEEIVQNFLLCERTSPWRALEFLTATRTRLIGRQSLC